VTFSSNGKMIALSPNDLTVKLWDTSSGVALQTHEIGVEVRNLSFSLDGMLVQIDEGIMDFTSHSFSNSVP